MKVFALLSLLVLSAHSLPFDGLLEGPETKWVVLVAGSNGWYNYRHQSDIYHSYQIIRNHGIPEKNIIVFHYDDLAHNSENPTPGVVINKPGGGDVYHGVPKDYTGIDVTPENFLAAIKGDQELEKRGKKVVKSGPNDHIFIYFADHGAPDLIAFPSKYLYAKDLNEALKEMHDNQKYSKLVFYVEACESGSMFNTLLPEDINIYATTAANPTESSWACYYDAERGTYLGDVYSVKWLENSDVKSLGTETLDQQFEVVKKETNTSHVMEYGDLSMGSLPLTQFQGDKPSEQQLMGENEKVVMMGAIDSGDVPLAIVSNQMNSANTLEKKQFYNDKYMQLVSGRNFLTFHLEKYVQSLEDIVGVGKTQDIMNVKQVVYNKDCYKRFVDTFHEKCLNLNQHSFVLRKLNVFVNVCEILAPLNTMPDKIADAITRLEAYCQENLSQGYPQPIL